MRELALFLLLSLPPAASAQAVLVSKTPYGRAAGPVRAVTAVFDRPMAALTSAENMGAACPLELFEVKDALTPENYPDFESASLAGFKQAEPVPGRCRWQGTQTVSFEPERPLGPARLYAARVKPDFSFNGQAAAEGAEWFFETPRPALKDSAPPDGQLWLEPDTVIFLALTQPADARRAREFLRLEERAPDGRASEALFAVRAARDEEVKKLWPYEWQEVSTGTVLAVRPARPLRPDHTYRLRLLAGLPAAGGNLGLEAEREIRFEPFFSFGVKSLPQRACLPQSFAVGFTNPVKYEDFYRHLKAAPPARLPAYDRGQHPERSYGDQHGRVAQSYLPDVFKAGERWDFTISADLPDVFGNRLGKEVSFSVGPEDYCPYWETPSGFGVLEGYLPARHPFTAVNAPAIGVLKAKVPAENLVPFLKSGMQDEALLAPGAAARSWSPTQQDRNFRLRTFVSFGDLFGPEEGGFAFLRSDGMHSQPSRALDNITRVGLTVKSSQDSTLVWTSFLRTGKPAAGVPVEIRSDDNKVLWTGTTDKQGFADAPGWLKLGLADWDRWQRPALWVFARHKNGAAVMSTAWNGGVEPWRFSVNYDQYPRPRRYAAALFTERGVYRPGETVNAKGLGRLLSGGDWERLDLPAVQFTLTDSRGNRVARATATVDAAFSSFDWAYKLSAAAPAGVWTLEASEPYEDDPAAVRAAEEGEEGEYGGYDGKERPFSFTETFRVEEFKPAVFEVKARSLEASYLAGETFRGAAEGWYLFGAPMSGSRADWTLRLQSAHYEPPGWEGYHFGGDFRGGSYDRLAGSGSAQLDDKGRADAEVKLEEKFGGGGNALRAHFEAGVTDPERQRLFGRASAWVHKADLYFGLKASGGFVEAGKPWSAEIAAVRPDGSPAPGAAGELKMIKRQWLSAQRAGLGGRLEWVTEVKDTVVSAWAFTASSAPASWSFTPDGGGYYILSVSGRDGRGREASSSFSFYAFGAGDAWWAREDSDIIELVSEKYDYKPGETAKVMVKSPYDEAQALVTVEREGVLDRWLVTTRGGADFIEVPIKEKYLPNAYVSVILFKGRAPEQKFGEGGDSDLSKPQAKFGYLSFNVSPAGRRLAVALKADRADYRPGQEVRLDLQVKDEAGAPSAAELTVFAVDEGVLALTGYATPDAFAAFYGPRPLNVLTADSRLHVIGQRGYGEKGEARGGGGGAGLAGVDLRSDFRPTAYWNPAVRAGADGRASVSFRLPDSLTRFRLMAVANSGRRFGSGEAAVTVSKPLSLRPALPRFARVGDAFDCGAVAHNYTSSAAAVSVELETSGAAVIVEGARELAAQLRPGGSAELAWRCRAQAAGETALRFRAAAGGETDGLEWTLRVKDWEPAEHSATGGVTDGSAPEDIARPYPGADGEVRVEVSPTAMAGLSEGARYLLEYPYGCLEQRLSRAMPVLAGSALVEAFGLGSLGTLKEETRRVFEKLGDFQHPSGGFCYWPACSAPDPYVTAYALEAAALGAKEGYASDAETLKRAADWLEKYLAQEKSAWAYPYAVSEDYAARAYAAYALALNGRNTGAYFSQLYLRRGQLPFLAKAYLLKAAKALGRDQETLRRLAGEIMGQARYAPDSLHFEDGEAMPWLHNSAVKTTAVMLDALLEAQGGFPGDEKAVKWLVKEKRALGRWRTTQENAWALRALQAFYRRYEKDEPDFKASVLAAGAAPLPLLERQFKGRGLAGAAASAPFGRVFGQQDSVRLLFSRAGAGRLYYTLRLGWKPQKRDKAAAEGLEIVRTVRPLDGGKALRAGARAVVTLTVRTPQDRTFVAVADPLPAGLEIVNTEFAVESAEGARALAAEAAGLGGFGRAERYDDRLEVFADYLAAGEHKYSYVVQATSPGSYYWPSALAEGMYEPEVFGRTAGGAAEVLR